MDFPQHGIAHKTRRQYLGLFAQPLSFVGEALLQVFGLFETVTLEHALFHSMRGRRERNQAFSSPIKATGRSVLAELCAPIWSSARTKVNNLE
jgi:hypothetical protein